MKPMKPMQPMKAPEPWWPSDLGEPASSGGQNDIKYAFFPEQRRLLVQQGGKTTTYDSGDHTITGVQQSGHGAPTFSDRSGSVSLDDLTQL